MDRVGLIKIMKIEGQWQCQPRPLQCTSCPIICHQGNRIQSNLLHIRWIDELYVHVITIL